MRDSFPASSQVRRGWLSAVLLTYLALGSLSCARNDRNSAAAASANPSADGSLARCDTTAPADRWTSVPLDSLATMRLPPDARPATGPGAGTTWLLGDYGSVGYRLQGRDSAVIPKMLRNPRAAEEGWCIGMAGGNAFFAQVFVGHRSTGSGRHVRALWRLEGGRELEITGVVDPSVGGVLDQIISSVRVLLPGG